MSKASTRRAQNAATSALTAEEHRGEGDSLQQALQHHCAVEKKNTEVITTQLPLRQALKPRHFDASDSTRQALKRHPVANGH